MQNQDVMALVFLFGGCVILFLYGLYDSQKFKKKHAHERARTTEYFDAMRAKEQRKIPLSVSHKRSEEEYHEESAVAATA